MSVPIIGITIGGPIDDPKEGCKEYTSYAEAIEEAGGEPKFLEPREITSDILADDLRSINGLLLTGGIDIHPDYYPSRNMPGDEEMTVKDLLDAYQMKCSKARDAYELPLARVAYRVHMPILGICRGFQLLNVALCGSLIKDIRTGRKHWAYRDGESKSHQKGESRSHEIKMVRSSKLFEILGTAPKVNSRHHQGIMEKEKSDLLKATAFAPDGIVEAVEAIDHPWALAVQWHPEKKADSYVNEPCKPLFRVFVEAAGRKS